MWEEPMEKRPKTYLDHIERRVTVLEHDKEVLEKKYLQLEKQYQEMKRTIDHYKED